MAAQAAPLPAHQTSTAEVTTSVLTCCPMEDIAPVTICASPAPAITISVRLARDAAVLAAQLAPRTSIAKATPIAGQLTTVQIKYRTTSRVVKA